LVVIATLDTLFPVARLSVKMHHCNNDNTTFTDEIQDTERKGANQTAPHLSVDYWIQERINFNPRRPLLYGTNESFAEVFVLRIVELSSSRDLRFCGRIKTESSHSRDA
jgi:hypothetical protein